jgi:hypothetical protein
LWYFFKKNHQNLFWSPYILTYYVVLYYINILFFSILILGLFVNVLFKNNVVKSKITVFKIHTIILILFFSSTQQIYIYNCILDTCFSTKIEIFKLSGGYISLYNCIYTVLFNNSNNIELLDNVFKVDNFLSPNNWKQIFEKNLYNFKNNFTGLYSYNLQLLTQLSGMLIYLLLIIPICFFKKFNKKILFIYL